MCWRDASWKLKKYVSCRDRSYHQLCLLEDSCSPFSPTLEVIAYFKLRLLGKCRVELCCQGVWFVLAMAWLVVAIVV